MTQTLPSGPPPFLWGETLPVWKRIVRPRSDGQVPSRASLEGRVIPHSITPTQTRSLL